MKLWATILAVGALAISAFANNTTTVDNHSSGKWTINVGFAIPEGDHEDAGVDSMFMFGADWHLYSLGQGSQSYIGVLAAFGDGDFDLESRTYGIHYGILFGLGQEQYSDWAVKLQGGYYNTKLEQGSFDEEEWGFGGLAALVYRPKGSNFTIEAGYFFFPEVEDIDNRGFSISVGIPVGR